MARILVKIDAGQGKPLGYWAVGAPAIRFRDGEVVLVDEEVVKDQPFMVPLTKAEAKKALAEAEAAAPEGAPVEEVAETEDVSDDKPKRGRKKKEE